MSGPWFYSVFHAQGRELLVDELGDADPFGMAPAAIVEHMLTAGHEPLVDLPQRKPFRQSGETHKLELGGRRFLVAVSREAETIGVQEVRDEPYAVPVQAGLTPVMFGANGGGTCSKD